MSTEKIEEFTYNIEKRLSDDKISLVELENGSRTIVLKVADETDVKERCFWLEHAKKASHTDESRQYNYIPPSTYNIMPQEDATIKITGNFEELEDAAEVLHRCHNYISAQKMKQLVTELDALHFKAQQEIFKAQKEIWKNERKAKREKKEKREKQIHTKYTRLAEKLGLDPNIIFPTPPKTIAEKNLSPAPTEANTSSTSTSSITKTI